MTDNTTMEPRAVTRRDLANGGLDALDKAKAGAIAVSRVAGGVSFASALEVMEFAKLMAISDKAVPMYLRGNPGACLAITFQAVEWQMSPFQVANKSYEVRDRIAYESQLVHAVIEARAPLQRRLMCDYDGDGDERVCVVTGLFDDGSERVYRSPLFKNIQPKNSPLWKSDPDQQHWYYASRAWCRKWCPDVLLGIYTREELAADPMVGREGDEVAPGLVARLAGAPPSDEGYRADHVVRELQSVAPAGRQIEEVNVAEAPPESDATNAPPPDASADKKAKGKGRGKKPAKPATWEEYVAHARAWIAAATDESDALARWDDERDMRESLQVPINERKHLQQMISDRFPQRQ